MAALSKYYSEILIGNKVSCAYVLHPTTTCNRFVLTHIPLIIFRTGQFFFPLYFVSDSLLFRFHLKMMIFFFRFIDSVISEST